MPAARRPPHEAAEGLAAVAPLATRWIELLLARHDPPLTVPQYLALRAISRERISASELARRTGVSGPAVSQLLAALADGGLIERQAAAEDRRRPRERRRSAQPRRCCASGLASCWQSCPVPRQTPSPACCRVLKPPCRAPRRHVGRRLRHGRRRTPRRGGAEATDAGGEPNPDRRAAPATLTSRSPRAPARRAPAGYRASGAAARSRTNSSAPSSSLARASSRRSSR